MQVWVAVLGNMLEDWAMAPLVRLPKEGHVTPVHLSEAVDDH